MKTIRAEDEQGQLTTEQIREVVREAVGELSTVRSVLVIHNDYSRHDYTHIVAPLLYQALESRGLERFDSLNASGTHRPMTQAELIEKLGLNPASHPKIGTMFNHEFDSPEQLEHVFDIPADFVAEKTNGNLSQVLSVGVNKLLFADYDLIVAINATVPHEALGYSGGTKMFFPGVSNPEVIALLHWAAVLMGIPQLIGRADNPARDVVNEGSKHIFAKIGDTPVLSLNMVYTEDQNHAVLPKGLFAAYGFDGFKDAHRYAADLSSRLHIIYLDRAMDVVVQQLPTMYDEVWTAGKGSYKLQRDGVLAEGAEIVLFAPHIHCFHSNERMDQEIRRIGYHGLDHVLAFCEQHPDFNKNVAAHVINVRGLGKMVDGVEHFPFKVTLATQISQADCESVGLGYRDPSKLRKEDFQQPGQLWISDGGQWLYARK
ncbi:MAG: DUF2088 domain-containing protein [Bdellovibrionales bacterium]|nr:DUF2088 domain-containing protein [Bdellovibrionales bacterium]